MLYPLFEQVYAMFVSGAGGEDPTKPLMPRVEGRGQCSEFDDCTMMHTQSHDRAP
jgi:hypothetical protein